VLAASDAPVFDPRSDQLAGALALLHAQGLAHADIKPENLLLTADVPLRLALILSLATEPPHHHPHSHPNAAS
jgi:serine/threonine protein kinase